MLDSLQELLCNARDHLGNAASAAERPHFFTEFPCCRTQPCFLVKRCSLCGQLLGYCLLPQSFLKVCNFSDELSNPVSACVQAPLSTTHLLQIYIASPTSSVRHFTTPRSCRFGVIVSDNSLRQRDHIFSLRMNIGFSLGVGLCGGISYLKDVHSEPVHFFEQEVPVSHGLFRFSPWSFSSKVQS